MHVALEYLQILGQDANGIPIIGKSQVITENDYVFSSGAVAWSDYGLSWDGFLHLVLQHG